MTRRRRAGPVTVVETFGQYRVRRPDAAARADLDDELARRLAVLLVAAWRRLETPPADPPPPAPNPPAAPRHDPGAAPMLAERDAARFVGFTTATLKAWRQTGRGPAFVRVGRSVRYRVADLDAFLAAHRVGR